ncbi:shikimate dehydrogenase [Shewanella marina]|uniref:shikimate dehydrogenase n=1 Tax=Shewanella marina TaxID=487319 RepID=UPI0004719E6D|nr:shikimate dehydrogenase [Shewanella marina]
MPDQYAVLGHPISHSKSPFIHAEFAKQTHQQMIYQAIDVEPVNFESFIADFVKSGAKGANVTVPFKEQVVALCHQLSPQAQMAGAVNTLIIDNHGNISGDNTDGVGLVNDLQQYIDLKNKTILLIGAGGAARGVILPLLEANIASLTITNRTNEKAQILVERFKAFGVVDSILMADLNQHYDVIINSTSASISGQVPAIPSAIINSNVLCYDMMYCEGDTSFNMWANKLGARTLDGIGMLVGQAAVSFNLWRGVQPNIKPIVSLLKVPQQKES